MTGRRPRGALRPGPAGSSAGRTYRPGPPACPPTRACCPESARLEESNTNGEKQLSPCLGVESPHPAVLRAKAWWGLRVGLCPKRLPEPPPGACRRHMASCKMDRGRQGQPVHANHRPGAGGGGEGGLRGAGQGAGGIGLMGPWPPGAHVREDARTKPIRALGGSQVPGWSPRRGRGAGRAHPAELSPHRSLKHCL